uniref:Uncharacterized protein n=1 Tax=Amphimedon queenslandica TaxID=400682 RepID=A0A1X7TVD9_AMPQE
MNLNALTCHNYASLLVDGEEVCFKRKISAVSGDNLASQYLGGYKSLASAHRKCRSCFAVKEDMQTKPRNCASHAQHIASLSQNTALQQHISSTYGINEDSILHQSLYFHVSEGLTPDIMHNVSEGCLQYKMKEMFKIFISNKIISLSDLNHAIQSFSYGPTDIKNKQSHISTNDEK